MYKKLVTSIPWLLVNRFTVLKIETDIDDSEPINISPPPTPKHNPPPRDQSKKEDCPSDSPPVC